MRRSHNMIPHLTSTASTDTAATPMVKPETLSATPEDSLINHAYQSLTGDVGQVPTFTAQKNGTPSVFAVHYDSDINTVIIHDTERKHQ